MDRTNIVKLFSFLEKQTGKKLSLSKRLQLGLPVSEEELDIKGDLSLANAKGLNLIRLPDNIRITGSLFLAGSSLLKLPNNLTVGRNLNISYTEIREIPESLKVGSGLYMESCPIEKIPDNLQINEIIHAPNSKLKHLPKNINPECQLNYNGTLIENLPLTLTVGSLLIARTKVKQLPIKLTVRGAINIANTGIEELPKPGNIKAGGFVYVFNTPLLEKYGKEYLITEYPHLKFNFNVV